MSLVQGSMDEVAAAAPTKNESSQFIVSNHFHRDFCLLWQIILNIIEFFFEDSVTIAMQKNSEGQKLFGRDSSLNKHRRICW